VLCASRCKIALSARPITANRSNNEYVALRDTYTTGTLLSIAKNWRYTLK